MTADESWIVPARELRPVDGSRAMRFHAGGQSEVPRLVQGGEGGTYLFKPYNQETREHLYEPALCDMVMWRRHLTAEDRAELDRRCAWPVLAVGEPGDVEGILVELAPQAMFERRLLPDGGTAETPRRLAELLRSPGRAEARGRRIGLERTYYEPPYKLAVLSDVFRTVDWLHEHGYVVGDLHPGNALFTVDPVPATFLIDCDSSVRMGGRGVMKQVDPEQYKLTGDVPFSRESDYYKFAWMVIRCVQEKSECWEPDTEVLGRVMSAGLAERLARCARGEEQQGLAEWLRVETAAWRGLVIGGRMFVSTDDATRRLWPPGVSAYGASPATVTAPTIVTPPPVTARVPAPRASGGAGVVVWVTAAVLLVLLLITFLGR